MIDYTIIGKRIQTRRQEQNITQEKLAERVGISVVYLSKKSKNGRVYPHVGKTLSKHLHRAGHRAFRHPFQHGDCPQRLCQRAGVWSCFNSCSIRVKPIALSLLEELSKL